VTVREAQVQVRAWVTPAEEEPQSQRGARQGMPGPSKWSLTFDTETTTELGQRLRLVQFQVRKGNTVTEQGIAVGPRLPRAERAIVEAYCREHGYQLLTLEKFIDLFFLIGFDRRGLIIGFNLPFDLSRLARRHAVSKPRKAQKLMRGGFTLTLSKWATRPAIRVKRISARAAFIQFTAPEGRLPEHRNKARGGDGGVFRGHFADVGTLAGALLGRKGTLASLAKTLGVVEKLHIGEDMLGAPITEELLDYAMRDVEVTWACQPIRRTRFRQTGAPLVFRSLGGQGAPSPAGHSRLAGGPARCARLVDRHGDGDLLRRPG
jgi:hypothetical protein